MRRRRVRLRALVALVTSLTLVTATPPPSPSSIRSSVVRPPIIVTATPTATPTPTIPQHRRQNTLVSPSEVITLNAPAATTTLAVMAPNQADSPTAAAGADEPWKTVPVAAQMGLIMPNPAYDIYTGLEYTFGFIDYGSRLNEYAWGWLRETTPMLIGPGPKGEVIAFNHTGGVNVSDVPQGHEMCGALTVWNYDHVYTYRFQHPGWYMLSVNNSYYQPKIENGRCENPIQYDEAFFATTTFSVKARPSQYHGSIVSSVTFWKPVSTETPPPPPGEPQPMSEGSKVGIGIGVTLAILLVIFWTIFFFCYRHKLFHRREAVALNRMRPEERWQFFAQNPTHCLNPAKPPRWYQRHSAGQRAAMKGDWEEYRGWDWKNMPLPYPPKFKKRNKRGKNANGETVVYTPVYYPGMTDTRYNPAELAVAAEHQQYSRQARAELQSYLQSQAQIHAILREQQRQTEIDRQAYMQYLKDTDLERREYEERAAEAAHAAYEQQEAEAQRAAWEHEQRMRDPEYRAFLRQQQAEMEHQAYLQQQEQMRQAQAAQQTAAAAGDLNAAYGHAYPVSPGYAAPLTPAEKIMHSYISQAQAHAAEVMRSQEIAEQQQQYTSPPPQAYRQPSPPPPPPPPKEYSRYQSPRRSRRR